MDRQERELPGGPLADDCAKLLSQAFSEKDGSAGGEAIGEG